MIHGVGKLVLSSNITVSGKWTYGVLDANSNPIISDGRITESISRATTSPLPVEYVHHDSLHLQVSNLLTDFAPLPYGDH